MNNQYTLTPLPYSYDALEPYIDARTVEIHHDKHQQAYVDKLNLAVNKHPELFSKSVEELLTNLEAIPEDIKKEVINQGGGVYNHTFYWNNLSPNSNKAPIGNLSAAIDKAFRNYEDFKTQFKAAATANFGSGWTWLAKDPSGNLVLLNTANQDSPISYGYKPLATIDIWEHAYYLKYQNRRPEYIDAYFSLINWDYAEQLFNA
ncbi:MAG: superoxide dismutase [Cellulosilyticaceae bacterium]